MLWLNRCGGVVEFVSGGACALAVIAQFVLRGEEGSDLFADTRMEVCDAIDLPEKPSSCCVHE